MLKSLHSATRSKTALYASVALSVLMVFGYLMTEQLEAVALFALTGYIAWQFSKNMVVVLATAFAVTALANAMGRLRPGRRALGLEGFEEEDEEHDDDDKKEKDSSEQEHTGDPEPHEEKPSSVGEIDADKTTESGVQHAGDIHEKLSQLRKLAVERGKEAEHSQKQFQANVDRVEGLLVGAGNLIESLQGVGGMFGQSSA